MFKLWVKIKKHQLVNKMPKPRNTQHVAIGIQEHALLKEYAYQNRTSMTQVLNQIINLTVNPST